MNIALWILQGLAAALFLATGSVKVLRSKEQIVKNPHLGWANDFSDGQIKAIGAAEVLGGAGLVLPWWLGIVPILTPIAAVCLGVIMIGAAVTHAKRKEPFVPVVVLTLIVFGIGVGRFARF